MLLLQACSTRGGLSRSASENSASQNQGAASSTGGSESLRVIEGRAINGYLENAVIYIDLNGDGKLSSGEPVTLSKQGAFSLQASSVVGPVVAVAVDQLSTAERAYASTALSAQGMEISDGLTTTYQHNGEVSRFSGRMESPSAVSNGATNITPLSTLQSALVREGMTLEAAQQQLQQRFGLDSNSDYLAGNDARATQISQAISSFYQLGSSALDSQGVDRQTIDTLANLLVQKINTDSALVAEDLLASSKDMQALLSQAANQLEREYDPVAVATVFDESFTSETVTRAQKVIWLANDSGRSAIDRVTSDADLLVAEEFAGLAGTQYGISMGQTERGGVLQWSDIVWSSELDMDAVADGSYRVFFRQNEAGTPLGQVEFILDRSAPDAIETPVSVYETAIQEYFEDFIPGFLQNLSIGEDFYSAQNQVESTGDYIQYLITTEMLDPAQITSDDPRWLDFPNLREARGVERSFYLYTSVVDLAGNRSRPNFFEYRLDQLAPLTPNLTSAVLAFDTGIYDWDFYSNDANIKNLIESLRAGESPDDHILLYSLGGQNYQGVNINEGVDLNNQPDGNYTVDFVQVDRADNFSTVNSFVFTLDRLAPALMWGQSEAKFGQGLLPIYPSALDENFNEWIQFGIQASDQNSSQQEDVEWRNFLGPLEQGEFNYYLRAIDRAGNISTSVNVGRFEIASKTLSFSDLASQEIERLFESSSTFGPETVSTLARLAGVEGVELVLSETELNAGAAAGYNPNVRSTQLAYHLGQSVSSVYASTKYTDPVRRHDLQLNLDEVAVKAQEGIATSFVVHPDGNDSNNILLGSNESDFFGTLRPGDFFIGGKGVDLVRLKSDLTPSGLAFLSDAETASLKTSFMDIFGESPEDLNESLKTPYMVYLSQPGGDDEGISITDAEIGLIGTTNIGIWSVAYNKFFDQHFFIHDSNDNDVYYGGEFSGAVGLAGNDTLQGGHGRDFLVGGSSSSNGGQDIIRGFSGDDFLVGGDYQTLTASLFDLDGGDGDDSLIIGNGVGNVAGGDGTDRFLIAPIPDSNAQMNINILDFNPLEDAIIFQFQGLLGIESGIFIDKERNEVTIDLARLFLGVDEVEASRLSVESLMTISVEGSMEGVTENVVAESWLEFDGAYSQVWSNLASGWESA